MRRRGSWRPKVLQKRISRAGAKMLRLLSFSGPPSSGNPGKIQRETSLASLPACRPSLAVEKHHDWSVVWLDRADLAGAERGTGREVARPKMRTGSEGRGDIAKGFAARGAKLRADHLGANPMTSLFTSRIDTLNRGARHCGHNALPPVAACRTCACEPPRQQRYV